MNKVFVYGTLLSGFGNWSRLLADELLLGEDVLEEKYTMVSLGGFPGVIQEGNTSIKGEVYEIGNNKLHYLDRLEGYSGERGGFYNRITINTKYGEAYMYTLPSTYLDTYPIVLSGDWREFTGKKYEKAKL